MKKFKITRTYKHTEELEVEAEDGFDALSIAYDMEFERNHDDWLHSEECVEIGDK